MNAARCSGLLPIQQTRGKIIHKPHLLSLEDVDELELLAEALHQVGALLLQHLHAVLRSRRARLVRVRAVLEK